MATGRLDRFRDLLRANKLDGYYIGREDMFQGEEVPASEERLAFISGFTGSAGFALVLGEQAAVFSDGRYTLQMATQCDKALWLTFTLPQAGLGDFVSMCDAKRARIGVDPGLVSTSAYERLDLELSRAGALLVRDKNGLVDQLWGEERPRFTPSRPFAMSRKHAGLGVKDKIARLDGELEGAGCDAAVISRADAVNWLVNLRGSDLANTPVNLAFALYHRKRGLAVLAPGHALEAMRAALGAGETGKLGIAVENLERFGELVADVAGAAGKAGKTRKAGKTGKTGDAGGVRVMYESGSLPHAMFDELSGTGVGMFGAPCPVTSMKVIKNSAELEGTRRAHIEDGAVMARFLCWLDSGAAGGLGESEIAARLLAMRSGSPRFLASSFETICGSGPNGAIVHYRATPGSDARLRNDSLLLVDSGAHYQDGTTDITRTIAIGKPDAEMRRAFTAVLRGHIALAAARFPDGTPGSQLDTIARAPLWSAGLDYAHGTGHGVGHVLQVHEGPANISKRGEEPLRAGMLLSNEPGHYREGAWGIRTENLVVVRRAGDGGFLEMETVTLCPIDRRLIDTEALQASERDWLDAYHTRVARTLAPELKGERECLEWLEAACRPV